MAKDYYILSMLPTIESLGAPAPMTPREFLALFEHEDPVRELIAAIFLSDDLLQRQAALAGGELNGFTPSVLSRSQLSGETDLPETLLPVSGDDAMRFVAPEDALWETYYQWLHTLATGSRSAFLRLHSAATIENGILHQLSCREVDRCFRDIQRPKRGAPLVAFLVPGLKIQPRLRWLLFGSPSVDTIRSPKTESHFFLRHARMNRLPLKGGTNDRRPFRVLLNVARDAF